MSLHVIVLLSHLQVLLNQDVRIKKSLFKCKCIFSMLFFLFDLYFFFFFSSRRRHTRWNCDWSSDVCSSDLLVAALAVALPYSGFLRWQQGSWSFTPKTALVHAPARAEWRLRDSTLALPRTTLAQRVMRDGPSIVRAFPSRLAAHAGRLVEAWPWPLLVLSLLGLLRREAWRASLAPLACPIAYAFLDAPHDIRFEHTLVPSLALLAASGSAWLTARARPLATVATAAAIAGVMWAWLGAAGNRLRSFDDGPMDVMRGAGAWVAQHSPP